MVPLPASLTAETPYPDIPDNMTWGNSLNLNVSLLSALGQCNRDKADIRQAEKKSGFLSPHYGEYYDFKVPTSGSIPWVWLQPRLDEQFPTRRPFRDEGWLPK